MQAMSIASGARRERTLCRSLQGWRSLVALITVAATCSVFLVPEGRAQSLDMKDGSIIGVDDITGSGNGDNQIFGFDLITGGTLLATEGGVVVLGGGIAVLDDGVTVAKGGVTVQNGGVKIEKGDLTVKSGKLDMMGGAIQNVGALGAMTATAGTLTVDGLATLKGGADLAGRDIMNVGSIAAATGNFTTLNSVAIANTGNIQTETLATTGKATLNSLEVTTNAEVKGSLVAGGTLAVDGLATFKGGADLAGKDITNVGSIAAATGNFTAVKSAAIANTGHIQTQTLATTGKATLNTLEVTTNADVKGNLAVGGDAEVKGGLTVAKGLAVSESFTVTPGSAISMGGNRVQNVADPIALTDAANKGYVDAGIAAAFREIDRNTQGIAIAMAMSGLALPAGKTFALGANLGFFEDRQAIAVQAAVRLSPFLTVTGGLGAGVQDADTLGGRVGVQAAW